MDQAKVDAVKKIPVIKGLTEMLTQTSDERRDP